MFTYDGQKKQIQKIVRRMNKKRTLQIFIERSQGSLLQKQIQFQQATEIKALQELKLNNILNNKNKRKTFSFTNSQNQTRNFKRHATQMNHKQLLISGIGKEIKSLNQNQTHQLKSPLNNQNFDKLSNFDANLLNLSLMNNIPENKVKKFSTRPALQELQQYLNEKDSLILERRKRIIQMLILCLMRRCHKKPCQALDVALQAYTFFFDIRRQNYLKSICLKLIGKIYNEISINQRKKNKNLELKFEAKAAKRLERKRHSSIMIKTLASQRVFFTRFAKKYSQSNLLIETNFEEQLTKMKQNINQNQNQNLKIKQTQIIQENSQPGRRNQRGKNVLMKINENFAVSLPCPQKLYPSLIGEKMVNYNLVIHQRDIQSASKLFPYEYPESIQNLISKKQYMFLLSSINGLIFSETRCYGTMQVLKKTVSYFIILTLLILGVTLYITNNQDINCFVLIGYLLCFILVSYLLAMMNTKCVYGSGQGNERVCLYLQKWNTRYLCENVIFRITANLQALIITWPRNQMQQQSVDDSYVDGINQSLQGMDGINQSLGMDQNSRHTLVQMQNNSVQSYMCNDQKQREENSVDNDAEIQKVSFSGFKDNKKMQKVLHQLKPITDIIIGKISDNSQGQNKERQKQTKSIKQKNKQTQQRSFYYPQQLLLTQNKLYIENKHEQQQNENVQITQQLDNKNIQQQISKEQNIFSFQYFLDQQQQQYPQQVPKQQTIINQVPEMQSNNFQNNNQQIIINSPQQFIKNNTQHSVDQNSENNLLLSDSLLKTFQFEEIDLQSQPQDHVIDNI